jgi:hypothetical protein
MYAKTNIKMKKKVNLFLTELKKIYDEKGEDEALFFVCDKLYDILDADKEVDIVDSILSELDVEYYSETVLVGFLVYTKNYESIMPNIKGLEGRNVVLKNRPELAARIRQKFERDNIEDVERILLGIE